MSQVFNKQQILSLFSALDRQLRHDDIVGEIFIVGGAVMCLALGARESTADVAALFRPASAVRKAAERVAAQEGVSTSWLNDAVKGYLSNASDFSVFLELGNLRVMTAQPETLLAMKCLSMRLGDQFHDIDDVRFLLRSLNIQSLDEAVSIIGRYYSMDRFPQKTLYILEEILQPYQS